MIEPGRLLAAARAAAVHAYAPYSGFPVGAAVADDTERIWTGCNVENASYGLSVCAERCATFSAVAAGARRIAAVAVSSPRARPCSPCGACRQVVFEFGGPQCMVVLEEADGSPRVLALAELLPQPFRPGGAQA